ncbi:MULTISPECIES: hypothetical protein [unclassified Aureimonas]|uniref:hypothetical protein n=1 Tax=unclassified Aureimonas TaxID=2615206 RepID=UPI000AA1AAF1|nr:MULTISPECIES: hypothetical protein [unclassified Aureimonas]
MGWDRLGVAFAPSGHQAFAISHAALPTPVSLGEDLFRIFFSSRAADSRSSVAYVDVSLGGEVRLQSDVCRAALAPGSDGSFDDNGVGIGSIVPFDDGHRLYYMGWNLGVRAPWRNSIGLAGSDEQAPTQFHRVFAGPLLDRSPEDPYTLSYPWVLRLAEDNWRLWYGSNLSWGASSADMSHVVKVARSRDGVRWERDGRTVIGFADRDEYAIARPTVVPIGGGFLMAFACRGERYRIGAAVSLDGETWQRADDVYGLLPDGAGWDGDATCYPALFWHHGRLWLAYNGNGYGATGFGFAVWRGEVPRVS